MTNPDLDPPKNQHLVLKRKTNGKIASRKDQSQKAVQLKAVQLTESGTGGGITSLLLPKSAKEKAKIDVIGEIYEVLPVVVRTGKKANKRGTKTVRQELNSAIENDELMARLAVLYEKQLGHNFGTRRTSGKDISGWIRGELIKRDSPAYRAVQSLASILLEVDRKDRWWADAFARRRKTQS